MDIIPIAIGLPAAILAIILLQRYMRFRRPIYSVREAELQVERLTVGTEKFVTVGPGSFVVDVQGASRPVSFTDRGFILFHRGVRRAGVQIPVSNPILVQAETMTTLTLPVPSGLGVDAEPPTFIDAAVSLANPHDTPLTIRARLRLNDEGDKYLYRGDAKLFRHLFQARGARHDVRRLFKTIRAQLRRRMRPTR